MPTVFPQLVVRPEYAEKRVIQYIAAAGPVILRLVTVAPVDVPAFRPTLYGAAFVQVTNIVVVALRITPV